jgi:riboflavin kinase / FMN adenylyltransferase
MRFYESLESTEKYANPVLTIGNYDGLHLGHKRIIERVKEKARELSGTSMLMTFDPHPLTILKPDMHLGLITPLPLKRVLIEETGIDVLFVLPFTAVFRLIPPEAFVEKILLGSLGIKGLIVGYDFRFGKDGRGDTSMLRIFAERYGFSFEVVGAITLGGEKIGSNRIRKLILDGDMKKAGQFLGRPYAIQGRVAQGEGRGRTLGFPTINLDTRYELIPKQGVYITEVDIAGKRFSSVTNIGNNPTFQGKSVTIETHVIDFSGDLYDREAILYFHERVRDEIRFKTIEDLKTRIALDVETARSYFKTSVH